MKRLEPNKKSIEVYNDFKDKLSLPWFFKKRYVKNSCYYSIDRTIQSLSDIFGTKHESVVYWKLVRKEINKL